MKTLAIIPARGGSKRIPRKNIKHFMGRPIIGYSIQKAIESELFDEIMVSTDDEEIAEISRSLRAKVPILRSKQNSSDHSSTFDVIQEVLAYYDSLDIHFDFVCCIYATSPLIEIVDLKNGFELLKKDRYSTVFPVVKFSYPIWRGFHLENQSKANLVWPEHQNKRSQDLPEVFHDAGMWYWLSVEKMGDKIFTENSGAIVLDEDKVQDIDTDIDWILAELKYKAIENSKRGV